MVFNKLVLTALVVALAGTHVDQDILDLGCCADTDGDG